MGRSIEYRDEVNKKLQKLKGRTQVIADELYKYTTGDWQTRWEHRDKLETLLMEGNPQNLGELFRNGPYQMFEKIQGKKLADKMCHIFSQLHFFTYSNSTYRRSFRTKDPSMYLDTVTGLLDLLYCPVEDIDVLRELKTQITDDDDFKGCSYSEYYLAVEIDEGNTEVIELVKDICLSDNNTKLLDYWIIRGILRSRNTELHKLLCDMLLAARLQEGLRQSILESADMGRIEAFVMIIKTVVENDLTRYSSAVRAIDVWMGLGESVDDKRITDKLIRLIYSYLTDKSAKKTAENSSDALELYAYLWVDSVYDVRDVVSSINKLMHGKKYQRLLALYFVFQIDSQDLQSEIAAGYIDEDDMDVLTFVLNNIHLNVNYYADKDAFYNQVASQKLLVNADFRNKFFDRLCRILPEIPQKGYKVTGKPFDWSDREITRGEVLKKLFNVAAYENDEKKNAILLENMAYSDSDSRLAYLKFFADEPHNENERTFVFAGLADKSIAVRSFALKIVAKLQLREEEIGEVLKLLSLKTGDIRQASVDILLALPDEKPLESVKSLLADKNENKRLGGLDMLLRLVNDGKLTVDAAKQVTTIMPKITEREAILIGELTSEKSKYTTENGYGLYDPDYMTKLKLKLPDSEYKMKDIFDFSPARMNKLFDSLCKLIDDNKDYTFITKDYDGKNVDNVLGTMTYIRYPNEETYKKSNRTVDDFVLPGVWRSWITDNKVTFAELCLFLFIERVSVYYRNYVPDYTPLINELIEKWFHTKKIGDLERYIKQKNYSGLAQNIIPLLRYEYSDMEIYNVTSGALMDLIRNIPEKNWKAQKREGNKNSFRNNDEMLMLCQEITIMQSIMEYACDGDEQYEGYVAIAYEFGRLAGMTCSGLSVEDMARACTIGLVPRDALLKMMLFADTNNIRDYAGKPRYAGAKETVKKYPVLQETADEAAARAIEIEIKRGDTPTLVSKYASQIQYHEGAENFANILIALGNETFERGYFYYSSDETKKHVLSSLLKASHPAKDDNAKTLAKALDGKVGEKRLLEAAMYSPSWLSIVADYLKWKGLESAAWYFQAHINEDFSAEKETEVARYSPITPNEFNDGAFDVEWFKDAYKTLGKARFEVLYDCAKYLTSGANHRRAQIFADATLGGLKINELQKDIKDKRNKDKLLAYSLVPLKKDREKDLLARYEFIQAFLKESKQFGAQRRESEAKVCAIALDNLARTAGFADALRLSWRMETLKIEQISGYFTPKEREGANISVVINEQGIASLQCEKEGKILASVPAKLKKDSYIAECREVVSSLKNQQKRTKAALENAMIRQDSFEYQELGSLMNHPVISPLLQKLLFACDDKIDTYTGFKGLSPKKALKIAHCYDIYKSGTWLKWQKHAFETQLVQPFKQIFRELYVPNDDELHEGNVSRRYAGHQVQVQKTVALLKSRGWTVDYEDGLQKVYYKENIIATMYSAADWFSPADVEAPTLEVIRFYDRKTRKPIPLADIPPVIFSEVMRDIDLVVSVAHVGGVDPEASHSTVEMRAAIVRELLTLLRVSNVEVKERHAQIKGILGEYTVHLGSGVVHKMGKGMINILAVPGQHRGRIFLPFADEDPRTAEIMSKILLLADDKAIKDPAILNQIGNG